MKYGREIPTLTSLDIDRFWASVEKGECWTWKGQRRRGYGRFTINGKQYAAHRVAWVLTNGAEPESEVLDHLCSNASCVNPAHLDDVTQSMNSHRGANGYGNRELCRAGLHDIIDPANVVEGKNGRQCRPCYEAAQTNHETKRRAREGFRESEAERQRAFRAANPTATCEHCGKEIARTGLARHVKRMHPRPWLPVEENKPESTDGSER